MHPLIIGAVSLSVIAVVAGALYLSGRSTANSQHADTDARWSLIARAVQPEDHIISGSANSPITLVVYSNLSCEYCRDFFMNAFPRLRQKYGASFVAVYRHIPLAIYPGSEFEARASECVARDVGEEAFRSYVGSIFSHSSYRNGLSTSTLMSMAVSLGDDPAAFTSCLSDPAIAARVNKDAQEAAIAGLTVAPSFVVKSANRAVTVEGSSFSRLDAAFAYILATQRK